jgi:glucose/arabinose dehydrogenase
MSPTAAPSGTPPSGAPEFVPLANGLGALTFITNAGDGSGNLYAVGQSGQVHRIVPGESGPPSTWLDIASRVSCCGERGLLGLAFHPDFESNGRFFVDYTDVNGNTVVSEFGLTAEGTGDPTSEKVVLTQKQPFSNHNGGMVAFGADGYLYIGLGDGGTGGDPQGNGQKLATFLGKILRIDVNSGDPYAIPADNPFQPGNAQGAQPEIWDWGVRNPWRFSFDRESGALFIGDVGQDQTEEIDVEPAGEGGRNYGWNTMEGDHCYGNPKCDSNGMTPPVVTYNHAFGCSVIGGYVYRGSRFPDLVGRYLYGDLCSGRLWTLDAQAALAGDPVTPEDFDRVNVSITSFGEDEAGELYMTTGDGAVLSLGAPG